MRRVIEPERCKGLQQARDKTLTPVRTERATKRVHRDRARGVRQQNREVVASEGIIGDEPDRPCSQRLW